MNLGDGESRVQVSSDFDGLGVNGFRLTMGCHASIWVLYGDELAETGPIAASEFPGLFQIVGVDSRGSVESFTYCGPEFKEFCTTIEDTEFVSADDVDGSIEIVASDDSVVVVFGLTAGLLETFGALAVERDFLRYQHPCRRGRRGPAE